MKIYGLLGRDINYSLSPVMHNAAFKASKIDAEYRLFDIEEEGLENFFSRIRNGEIAGCNVTIPYKEKVFDFVDTCDTLAKEIGAINTIVNREGKLIGYNTDYYGFIDALTGEKPGDLGFSPKGKNIFIFGAGGAARSLTLALMNSGAKRIAITDLDRRRAESLASSVVKQGKEDCIMTIVEDESQFEEFISKSHLLINATPCGMKENERPLFDYNYIHPGLYVFDLIYAKKTLLVKEARSRGAKAVNGLSMLLYQAAHAFSIWTEKPAPISIMRKALSERIKV